MRKILFYLIVIYTTFSCNDDIDFVPYQQQVIVEGSIENGRYASVLLSTSASFTESLDLSDLLVHAIRNAKVIISDGEFSEILLLKTNNNQIPPYEYVTQTMKGEVGKTYDLSIIYGKDTITATTSIATPVKIDSAWFVKKNPTDRVGYIHIQFVNESANYYQISTKTPTDNIYTPCLYGNLDNTLYPRNESVQMQINKGPIIYPEKDYTTYFPDSIQISVKLAVQMQDSYAFWTSYQNEVLNSQNPIFPSTNQLKSNVKGALGIWAGYGVSSIIVSGSE